MAVVHVIEVEEQGVPASHQQELVQVVKLCSTDGMGQHVPALKSTQKVGLIAKIKQSFFAYIFGQMFYSILLLIVDSYSTINAVYTMWVVCCV